MTVALSPQPAAASQRDAVLSFITEQAWLDLACELIPAGQPEAENPLDPDLPGGKEEGIALLLADKLTALIEINRNLANGLRGNA